jgi:hypothetical protein
MNNQEQNLSWGYRPLTTHNRKRNAIRASELERSPQWPAEGKSQTGNGAPARSPLPPSAGLSVRCDQNAISKAKINALIERFKPVTVSQACMAGIN